VGVRTKFLTTQQREMVIQALQVGCPVKHAAMAAGIPNSTFAGWITNGRAELHRREQGDEPNPAHDDWCKLVTDVDTAIATGAVSQVVSIQRAANAGRWQAAAWLLSRRHPEEWGPPEQRIQIGQTTEDVSPRESIMAELDRLDERLALPSPDTDVGEP
jgi:hypothetical protein